MACQKRRGGEVEDPFAAVAARAGKRQRCDAHSTASPLTVYSAQAAPCHFANVLSVSPTFDGMQAEDVEMQGAAEADSACAAPMEAEEAWTTSSMYQGVREHLQTAVSQGHGWECGYVAAGRVKHHRFYGTATQAPLQRGVDFPACSLAHQRATSDDDAMGL